jgi:4a-hydroxytetrahydrobiopterin dehydratase
VLKKSSFLLKKKCVPARQDVLKGSQLDHLYEELENGWSIINEHHLEKEYVFNNFNQALTFVNQVGEVAEKEQHHPDIHLSWGKVKIILWTHKINSLTENDFILAAKCDEEFAEAKSHKACF